MGSELEPVRGRGRDRDRRGKISGYRSVEKRGGEVLGFEVREWKTMRKRFIVFHSRVSKPSNEARMTKAVDVKICEIVVGGWRM